MSKISTFIVVLLTFGALITPWLFATETCPETKVKTGMCGNIQNAANGVIGCRHFTCAGHLYSTLTEGLPPCTSRVEIGECKENAPISEEDNHPEQTKTGVNILADQIVCYTYHECYSKAFTNNCVPRKTLEKHMVSPLATFNCN